jgi:DNA polymerase III subunit delta'
VSDAAASAPGTLAPAANPDLLGHAAAERALVAAFRSGRMPPAWLVSGPAGIGKATLAYRFARWLLAGGPAGGGLFGDDTASLALDPADRTFRLVAAGGHPDLFVVMRRPDPEKGRMPSEIPVKHAREAIDFMRLTPGLGGWRVCIVDSVDELNRSGANALLKIVEEPPPRAVFLLVAHAPQLVAPTIRSRCRKLPLAPLADADVRKLVARHRPDLPAEDAARLAALAEGSIGRALALAEAGGLDLHRELEALLAGLPALAPGAADVLAERAGKSEAAAGTLRDLLLREIALAVKGGKGALAPLAAGRLDRWAALWDNTRRLFDRAEAQSLDRKQAMLEILYDLQAAAA